MHALACQPHRRMTYMVWRNRLLLLEDFKQIEHKKED
ncbi:hypothetical protein Krac_3226 [Ktedonobacter racemifer DSM 44963]|uniref:Uncharacterized protein n=1 Tax=Ktedonobacter racemifer DSM 44963 TaxID=485913 RepID=D6U0S5_KTERA|nr:hypothetical protein Krac_3226 [Ktedonobacter racemifer DSM 44963]